MASRRGITTYSEKMKGSPRNYDWGVRFDLTDGFLGITQYDGEMVKDRVLLSPGQARELVNFISGPRLATSVPF